MAVRPPVVVTSRAELIGNGGPRGWSRRDGFALPESPWRVDHLRWVCVGVVDDGPSAEAAVEAHARGAGLLVAVELPAAARVQFLDDLRRAAVSDPLALDAPVVVFDPNASAALLSSVQTALLDALAEGNTLAASARSLHLSTRTGHRRLAEARATLGVSTTAAAIARWVAERDHLCSE